MKKTIGFLLFFIGLGMFIMFFIEVNLLSFIIAAGFMLSGCRLYFVED